MRTFLVLFVTMLLVAGQSAHGAFRLVHPEVRTDAPAAMARIEVANGEKSTTLSSGSTRGERRIQKLLHRIRRVLPEGVNERIEINSLLSLIFGAVALISLSFFPFLILLSIPALILGIVGLGRVKRDGKKGKGLAIAGIVTGALGILVMLAGLVTAILILAFFLK